MGKCNKKLSPLGGDGGGLLHWVADRGRHYGCDDLKVLLMENTVDTIVVRDGETDKIQHAVSRSLAVDMYLDGRNGFVYTSNLDPTELDLLLKQGVEATRMLSPDPSRALADPARYYKGTTFDLHIFDDDLPAVSPEDKLALTRANAAEVVGRDKRIISAESHYSDRSNRMSLLITNGFEGWKRNTRVQLSTNVTVDGLDGQHPMDGWGETRIHYAQIPRQGIGQTALERALRKIGQRPAPSGKYTMIVESPVAGNLLSPLIDAMKGVALQQRMSFLVDRMDERVASPLLHVVDDPLTPGQRGASLFDIDGVATERRVLFDEGILRTFFIDSSDAQKLHIPATTLEPHHMVFRQGNDSLPELLAHHSRAILVTDFNGGNCDPVTGRFSYGIEGFLVENGIMTQPISGMNITGDMLSLWQSLIEVGADADPWEVDEIPSLVFSDVDFSGV